MKKTTYFAALAAMLTLLATGCDNGMTDAAVAAVATGQRPGTGSSHVPSMPDGEIDDDGVLTKYTGSETAVVIPDGVTGIGYQAFGGCKSLTNLTIPASVTSIGWDAFYGCTSLTDVTYTGTLAQWCALSNDEYLMYYARTVTMRDGTDLKQVTTLAIPDGVTDIGSCAFAFCTSLASVTIPASVTSIGWGAFGGCTKLKEIQFNGTKAQWQAIEGSSGVNVTCVFCTDGYLGVKDAPAYLIMVGTKVTGYADGLPANLVIPDGVTGIGDEAFRGCTNLVSVTIPDSVTSIEGYAFYGCTSLASVTIPDGVTSIGYNAFYGCTSLASVTIPASVTDITWSAFEGCANLESVTYDGTLAQWCAMNGVGNFMYYAKHVTVEGTDLKQAESIEIPDGVTRIGEHAFEGCTSLTSVTIPASVTGIGSWAFYKCDKLTDVTYGGTLAQWCAMYNDEYLMYNAKHVTVEGTDLKQAENLEIPDGVTSIGSYAFYGCESLASVTIPASVTRIGWGAFYRCDKLMDVTYGGTLAQWCAMDNDPLLMSPETVTMSDGTDLKQTENLEIPDGVTNIGVAAFMRCESLASVTIPASVTSIEGWAFAGCESLASVTYLGTKDGWSNITKDFYIFINTNVTEITGKDGVTFTVDEDGTITE